MNKQLLTIHEFVQRYSISRSAAYAEMKAGRLKFIKRGRRRLIPALDAQAWLEQLRKESTA